MSHRASASAVNNVTPIRSAGRWSKDQVLSEARRRTKDEFSQRGTAKMLAELLAEAGWSSDEFIDALCQDVVRKGVH